MGFRSIAEGTITADGSEQAVLETRQAGRISGYIDLAQMEAADVITISQYVALNGAFKRYASEQYSGAQTDPVVYITPKEVASGLQVKLQQTAGVFRQFDYDFIIEEVPGAQFKL